MLRAIVFGSSQLVFRSQLTMVSTQAQQNTSTDPKYLGLPFEIIDLCNAYPFGLRDSQYTKYLFLPFLPPRERASQLTDLYYQNVAWM
jgi:hypothetical protein